MKTVITIAGLVLASAISIPASATSKSEALTMCKLQAQNTFENITRIRTAKIKERSTGTYVKLRVAMEGADTEVVTCTVQDGIASLTTKDGNLVASKNPVIATGSE